MAKKLDVTKMVDGAKKAVGFIIGDVVTAVGLKSVLEKKMEEKLKPAPRPILDYLIDHLDNFDVQNKAGTQAAIASLNLKKHLKEAVDKGQENRTVRALCALLELDRVEDKKYEPTYTRTRRRLKEIGLMESKDFWQTIELLIDNPFQELVQAGLKKVKKIGNISTATKALSQFNNAFEKEFLKPKKGRR